MRRRETLRPSHALSATSDEHSFELHERLNQKHILLMKERFNREPGNRMEKHVFRRALNQVAGIVYDDDEYNMLFLKIDVCRTTTDVTWGEFLLYLILGFQGQEMSKYSSQLEPPIKSAPRELRSHHRHPINRIVFMPEVHPEQRIVNHLYGSYVTCSKDGLINYWSIDMEKQRTVYSKSPDLKVQSTWITDLVVLPDVNVMCTSSSERDLRFYDTTAQKFQLRIHISSFDDAVCAMYYKFYKDIRKESKLLLGDMAGKVRIIKFLPKGRGPFKSKPRTPLISIRFEQFMKGAIRLMTIELLQTSHTDWVRQVAYYENIHCVVSVSTCSRQSMCINNMKGKDARYSFKVPKGFMCFAIEKSVHMIATGGPDCLVRVWNPFVPGRAISVFRGHHAGIIAIVLQDGGSILCSLSEDKAIKVWNVVEQTCIQNFLGLPSSLGERTPMCTYYNPESRQMFVASKKIAIFQIYPLMNGEYTDGLTHSKEVSVVLYNTLFKVIITCGFDSFIIVWNPWTGRRINIVRQAHTETRQGETLPIEITAAAFDPSSQFLITGASNGTLKIWNFNTGMCTRNMNIGENCEVNSIVWLKSRILVMGENRGVTEFADSDDVGANTFKNWSARHAEDVLCATARRPQSLVTADYCGELIFWMLETGQPYGMYNVMNPRERIQMQNTQRLSKKDMRRPTKSIRKGYARPSVEIRRKITKEIGKRDTSSIFRVPIHAMIFLCSRPMLPNVGSLLVSLETGIIQMWSHHSSGGFQASFSAVHNIRDYVIAMCTDEKNQYLFTGHMGGYIKTWLMTNYAMPEEKHVHICMPKIRLTFPFLWNDTIVGRAQRAHRIFKYPVLLNSFKGHLKPVTGLVYLDTNTILISCSSDCSARIWTLGGKYMGLLGTFKFWNHIIPDQPPDDYRKYNLPADLERCSSFTSYKVFKGGMVERPLTKKQRQRQWEAMQTEVRGLYGHRVDIDHVLGHHFKLPERTCKHNDVILDTTLRVIPVYSEITTSEPEKIDEPPIPELYKQIKMQHTSVIMKTNTLGIR